jgi:hypothetical protein
MQLRDVTTYLIGEDRLSRILSYIEFVFGITIAVLTYPFTSSLIIAVIISLLVFVASKVLISWIQTFPFLSLKVYQEPIINKRTFLRATLPRGYSSWLNLSKERMNTAGIMPISYPSGNALCVSVPTYEICNFSSNTLGLAFRRDEEFPAKWKDNPQRYPFMNRVDRSGTLDSSYYFTGKDIEKFAKTRRMKVDDELAICVTGLSLGRFELCINYAIVRYWDLYVLVNQVEYMIGRFPGRETGFPINIILEHLPRIAKNDFALFQKIPPILGFELILITRDKPPKFIFQKRSGNVATYRGILVPSVCGGYEPSKATLRFEGWEEGILRELENELGIVPHNIRDLRLLGLVHDIPTSEVYFIAIAHAKEEFDVIKRRVTESRRANSELRITENWEHFDLISFDVRELADFSGEWRSHIERIGSQEEIAKYLERLMPVLYYLQKEKIP